MRNKRDSKINSNGLDNVSAILPAITFCPEKKYTLPAPVQIYLPYANISLQKLFLLSCFLIFETTFWMFFIFVNNLFLFLKQQTYCSLTVTPQAS